MHPFQNDAYWSHVCDELAQNDFVVLDAFLPEEFLQNLTQFFRNRESGMQPAKVGQASVEKRVPEIRSDMTYWLDRSRDEELNFFFLLIEEVMERLKHELFLSLQGYEFHMAMYPAGGFYKPHLDQFDARSNRMISMILYLNDNWQPGDGGELRIHKNNDLIDVQPLLNRLVLFRSDVVLHEVLPAHRTRRSITGWLLKRPSGVGVLGL